MKKTLTILFFLAIGTLSYAQQIAVVAPGGATSIYTSLDNAVKEAAAGSTIYLSGGLFYIADETKITKKLNIIGIGHRFDNDNVDGNTQVSGNLFFVEGSDNSSVSAIYLTGNIKISSGKIGAAYAVNSILVRFVNANSISVANTNSRDVLINQNYFRGDCGAGGSATHFKNNVLRSIGSVTGGVIENNVITKSYLDFPFYGVSYSQIKNNTIINPGKIINGSNNVINNNMIKDTAWGNNSIEISNWQDEFEGLYNSVDPAYNYHLKSSSGGKVKGTDGTDIGIYGGSGFSDKALPPGPRIIRKKIADRTDSDGNLHIEIEVKVEN